MDRLEAQHINPYTVPGLLPALLGIAMIVLGALLGVRSWRRGAALTPVRGSRSNARRRAPLALVIAWSWSTRSCLSATACRSGSPRASTFALDHPAARRPQRTKRAQLTWRDVASPSQSASGSGVVITYVFQDLFLVRLP
jgi:hypothetical protein